MPAEGSNASRYSGRRIGTPRFKAALLILSLFRRVFNSIGLTQHFRPGASVGSLHRLRPGWRHGELAVCDVGSWPDPEAPAAGPAGPLTEVDLPCRRSEGHGSF